MKLKDNYQLVTLHWPGQDSRLSSMATCILSIFYLISQQRDKATPEKILKLAVGHNDKLYKVYCPSLLSCVSCYRETPLQCTRHLTPSVQSEMNSSVNSQYYNSREGNQILQLIECTRLHIFLERNKKIMLIANFPCRQKTQLLKGVSGELSRL